MESFLISPFILLGRMISHLHPLPRDYRIFFFFPFYHTGGAEKVHYQVAKAAGGKDCIIFFTKKSKGSPFLKYFKESGCEIRDISRFTGNKWLYFLNLIWRGIVTGYINSQKERPVIFNGQCNFGYKISPWIKKDIRQIELIHSFNSFSYIRTPFLPFISETVMISKKRIEDHLDYYNKINAPLLYIEKIRYIPNAVPLPASPVEKNPATFTVLFAGRGGKEKRVHLVAAIAREVTRKNPGIQFEIIGDVSGILRPSDHPYITFYGELDDETRIGERYANASLLLLTSSTEGFPLVVIEAMTHGCAILATAVGDIPYHVKEGVNGFLFSNTADEGRIIEEGVSKIPELKNNPGLLQTLSSNNIQYAGNNFGIEKFNSSYRQLFEPVK